MLFTAKLQKPDLPQKALSVMIDRTIRSSGLLAFLSPEDFQTLIALWTFVDESGRCDLSARTLGQTLDLSEKQAQKRLKKLCSLRWHGRPLVVRENGRETGRFLPTGYRVMEIAGLKVIPYSILQVGKPSGGGSNGETREQDADAVPRREGTASLPKRTSTSGTPVPEAERKAHNSSGITDNNCVGVSSVNNKHTEEKTNDMRSAGEKKRIFNMLLGSGVSGSIASELLERYPPERIARQLQMLPFRNAKEPAAMLIKAIKEDWAAPAAYLARKREEAERKAKVEAEARADQRREAWRKRVEEAKAKLSPVELEEIIRAAEEKVSREMRGVLHGKAPERLVKAEVNKIIAGKYLKHAGS